jgi:hypothetical protein
MDQDPLLFEEYVASIKYSMTPEERKEVSEPVLRDFIWIVNQQHKSRVFSG